MKKNIQKIIIILLFFIFTTGYVNANNEESDIMNELIEKQSDTLRNIKLYR